MLTGKRANSLSLYCDFVEITPALRSEMQTSKCRPQCGCDGNVGVKVFLVRKVIMTKTEGGREGLTGRDL